MRRWCFTRALFSIPLGLERGQTGSYHSSLAFEFLSKGIAKSSDRRLKAAVAHYGRAPSFAMPRVPLLPLGPELGDELVGALERHEFAMPGLAESLAAR